MKRPSFILLFVILTLNEEIGALTVPCSSDDACLQVINAANKPKCHAPLCYCIKPGKQIYEPCTEKELSVKPRSRDEATTVGKVDGCSKTEDCQKVKMSVCKSGACECPETHILNGNRDSCLPKAQNLDDECTESVQCAADSLGEALCVERRCRCELGHHYSASSKRCIRNTEYGHPCDRANDSCYHSDGKGGDNTLECQGNTCACKPEHFLNNELVCVYSGAAMNIVQLFLLFIMLLLLKMN
ncbi:uncharacterized protein LOC106649813 [Trichogramma pretiosum]|uniref:uncharacterized protein LOC106649813 n=1 Tax=Trichogramma pretiosum TaxID=7493 RepID=UPI0006C94219|nr:uncharacterized protein LOC106649813 [Trichogramma pretiosum]